MKKILCMLMTLLLLVGCAPVDTASENTSKQNYITGVWVSYSELDTMLASNFKTEFDTAVQDCKQRGITDMFVHVRPFCDSYYKSEYFPLRTAALSCDFDVLEYMVNVCHQNNIKFHAWVNPYRVKTADNDISSLPKKSPAKQWLCDNDSENDINVSVIDGVYFNPAGQQAQALIINGIREIIENYNVDGIHFDDYFYPTTDENFDAQSYNMYCDNTKNPLSLADFRRANVNALISGTYTAIKFKDKNIIFSVSPSASLKDNYNKHYADVLAWTESNCVDYIIPQLYFGFEYPDSSFRFENLVKEWQVSLKKTDADLIIGLASYKINTQNEPDKQEWANGTEVLKKQIEMCKNEKEIQGHVYFSYSSMREFL